MESKGNSFYEVTYIISTPNSIWLIRWCSSASNCDCPSMRMVRRRECLALSRRQRVCRIPVYDRAMYLYPLDTAQALSMLF